MEASVVDQSYVAIGGNSRGFPRNGFGVRAGEFDDLDAKVNGLLNADAAEFAFAMTSEPFAHVAMLVNGVKSRRFLLQKCGANFFIAENVQATTRNQCHPRIVEAKLGRLYSSAQTRGGTRYRRMPAKWRWFALFCRENPHSVDMAALYAHWIETASSDRRLTESRSGMAAKPN